ncbi:MAG: hypothetical protein JXB10_14825 [Pirellulales bacterium]|nr:hypothetical protein [Pirellulales bacterium]
MMVLTYEGVVENGRIQVLSGDPLPEKAKVYIVFPDIYTVDLPPVALIRSPRLGNPEQARDLAKEIFDVNEQPKIED